jgi:hypothetical protein
VPLGGGIVVQISAWGFWERGVGRKTAKVGRGQARGAARLGFVGLKPDPPADWGCVGRKVELPADGGLSG